jgi:hypothetical protein
MTPMHSFGTLPPWTHLPVHLVLPCPCHDYKYLYFKGFLTDERTDSKDIDRGL